MSTDMDLLPFERDPEPPGGEGSVCPVPAGPDGRRRTGRVWRMGPGVCCGRATLSAARAPVPPLPNEDDNDDLLDRREAAALLGCLPRSWDVYKNHPLLTEHMTEAGGVEHWPRGIAHRYQAARLGKHATVGRPAHSGDHVPRDQLLDVTAPLLDADPTTSAAAVTEVLGVHRNTAQDALLRLRADRMADLMHTDPSLTPDRAAVALGYPAGQVRRATVRAQAVLRARRAAPYLADVAQALNCQGWTTMAAAPTVHYPAGDVVTATLTLDGPTPPAPALVWDERTDGAPPPPAATPSPKAGRSRRRATASATRGRRHTNPRRPDRGSYLFSRMTSSFMHFSRASAASPLSVN
ncbi:hypothetical protein [Streptomyces sp. Tu10]|uniref:hypothetical protein n=1 Tax=Streptomyces sp. Tu10 TaxID=2838018 RepID=UPI001BDDB99B|nr:hypothetical protein [Streptomyces sp. Tu10]MBT1105647.1 hypothetical protein [Streptomyces sp. Tu10]